MFDIHRTFPCPNCNEIISEQMTVCRFCSVPLDPGIAALVAERQAKVNQAYSDSSYLRNAAVSMFVFLAVGLFLTIAYLGFLITFVLTIILLARWQIKFGALLTNDPDYAKAKRSRNISALLIAVAFPLGIIFSPFIDVVIESVGDIVAALF
jgi:hypothetical protein